MFGYMQIFSVITALFFLFPGLGISSERDGFFTTDNMIANSLKMLGKGYVYQTDIVKTKDKKIRQLQAMSPVDFRNHYGEIYSYIGEAEENFGFSKNLSQKAVINQITDLDKQTIYEMIGSVPNRIIAKRFHHELDILLADVPDGKIKDKISFIWDGVVDRINRLQGSP
jgi:hypothetical protein